MMKRVQSLQALRGIGFLLIFCSHCTFIEVFSSSWGAVGVSIFIILSGYVVTFNPEALSMKSDLKAIPYTKKRIQKIYPLHVIMLCVRLAFDFFLGIKVPISVILLNFTMLKSFVPKQEIYYSLGGRQLVFNSYLLICIFNAFSFETSQDIEKEKGRMFVCIHSNINFQNNLDIYMAHKRKFIMDMLYKSIIPSDGLFSGNDIRRQY